MELDLRTVADFVKKAETEDLLDRVTVFRDGMEPAAVDLMENELWRRGVTPTQVGEHDRQRRERLVLAADGVAVRCAYCDRPAVSRRWGWFRPKRYVPGTLWFMPWNLLLFVLWNTPRPYPWPVPRCAVHDPKAAAEAAQGD